MYDRQETSYRTSLSAQFEGKKLEDYLDLSSVEGLQNNSVIKFVEGRAAHDCTVKPCSTASTTPNQNSTLFEEPDGSYKFGICEIFLVDHFTVNYICYKPVSLLKVNIDQVVCRLLPHAMPRPLQSRTL